MKNKRIIIALGDFIILIMVVVLLVGLGTMFVVEKEKYESFKMMGWADLPNNPKLAGISDNQGDYYCVWTKGMNPETITDTETHEKCHLLVNDNKKHFCKLEED